MPNIPTALSSLGVDNFKSYTKDQYRSFLYNKLRKLSNWEEIDTVINKAGTLDLIVELISSAAEISSFYNLRSEQESFLEYAELDQSVFAKARELGYRVSRYSSPAITLKYNAIATREMRRGDIIGTYGEYDLVYFDETQKIEKGDYIQVLIGKYREVSSDIDFNSEEDIYTKLSPIYLKSIDNTNVVLFFDDKLYEKTLFPEDYIVYNNWCDYSQSQTETNIYVANFKLKYGLYEVFSKSNAVKKYTIQYIETDGKLSDFDSKSLDITNDWIFYRIDSYGFDCESISDIVKYAPLVYSLQRRAVTENDYKFLLTSLPQFKDVSIMPYQGVHGNYKFTLKDIAIGNYQISVNEKSYSYQNISENATNDEIIYALYEQIKLNELVKVSIQGNTGNTYLIITSISTKSLLNVSCNKDHGVMTTLAVQTPPARCTLHVRYVSAITDDEPVSLTQYEYKQVAAVVDLYKLVGLTLLYEHCAKQEVLLRFMISLENTEDKELVNELIKNIISEYDLKTDIVIDTNDIANSIMKYGNFKYGRVIITNVLDLTKKTIEIPKSKYSKITYEVVYAN